MMAILESVCEFIGAWFLVACVAALTWVWCAPSIRSGPKPTRPAPMVDLTAERIRRRDAKVRGRIHHPLHDPVEYATIDELMPNVVEVDS